MAGTGAAADCFVCRKHAERGALLPGLAPEITELVRSLREYLAARPG